MLKEGLGIAIPYVLASLGGAMSELGGVVNIGLEGILLNGAFFAVLLSYATGSPWLGLAAGVAAGGLTAGLHAWACLKFKVDQIISGLAINLLAVGLTKTVLKLVFHSASNSSRVEGLPFWHLPAAGDVSPVLLATLAAVILCHILVYRTPFGLRLRAVGEHPQAAESLGLSVVRLRAAGVVISGLLAGLGGAYMSLDQHQFTDGMSGGRGFIALAAVVTGAWRPGAVALAALLFGLAETLQIELQTRGVQIPSQFVQMIPYALTLAAVAGLLGRAVPPAADGVPYESDQ